MQKWMTTRANPVSGRHRLGTFPQLVVVMAKLNVRITPTTKLLL